MVQKRKTFGEVACVKASRPPGTLPELTIEHMQKNQARGVLTQLVPDCNVVIEMIRAASSDNPEEALAATNRLLPFTSFLQSCQAQGIRYFISPFFGLNEMRRSEAASGPGALDRFSTIHDLYWQDTHPHLQPDLDTVGLLTRNFQAMPLESQAMLAQNYAGLLLMLVVARDLAHLPPFARFSAYLRLYRRMIDIVSIRAITIARFVFAESPGEGSRLFLTWQNIASNFTGRKKSDTRFPRTAHQMDRAAVNGALDLLILDAALLADYKGLEGQKLDTWIVTADLKLAALTDAVHHTDGGTGETGRYVVVEDFSDEGEYWRRTQECVTRLQSQARLDLKPSMKRQHARALAILALAEQGIGGQQRPPGQPLRAWRTGATDDVANVVLPPFPFP
jgi:hypothetical protein